MAEDYLHRGKKYVKQGTVKIDKTIRIKLWIWRIVYAVIFFAIVGTGGYITMKVIDKPIYYNGEWITTAGNDHHSLNEGDKVLVGPEEYTLSSSIGYLTKSTPVSEMKIVGLPNSIVALGNKTKIGNDEYVAECISGGCEAGQYVSINYKQVLYKKNNK